MGSSTSSLERFDAIRAANPDLAINLYGMTPGGPVTLEVIAPDGEAFTWSAETATAVFAMAFPEVDLAGPAPPERQETAPNIFD